jgi:hypothetical protein
MIFKHATKLLNQRRHEIVEQMERVVSSPCYRTEKGKKVSGHNHQYLALQKVYKEVEDELKTIEAL